MSIEWSSSGLDLHLDWSGTRDRGPGLTDAIRRAVRDGRLAAGVRLPATRALAEDLGIARGTVTRAYAQLAAEGYLRTRPGAAAVVAALPDTVAAPYSSPVAPRPPEWRWNLQPGRPDVGAFPMATWLAAGRRALTAATAADLDYGDAAGHAALRTALADYLGRARGVVAGPDRIIVCAGFGQGLNLLGAVLRARGASTIAFEDPSLPQSREVVAALGLTCVPIPVDQDGILVDRLAAAAPDAVVITPAHQYPLGATLHPHRRAAIVELARTTGMLVIEDDYDGEFRFDRRPVGAVQALAPDRVVYAGTASKTLAPGLRLSWLVVPDRLVEPISTRRRLDGRHTGVMEQLTMAEFIRSGHYDQHVRRCRTRYRRRRDRLLTLLSRLKGELAPAGIAAGLHMVVLLGDGPADRTESAVLERAARHSVLLEPLGRTWLSAGPHPAGIVLGYATPADHAFGPALRALADVLGGPVDDGR